jgi:hypothetical protein
LISGLDPGLSLFSRLRTTPNAMADDSKSDSPRQPMNVYTAMLLLSFVAVSTGCLILALDLFFRRMQLPLKP